jgi:phospholipid/cholesterol/gamma-HCH transport system substrate-binding protein
MDERLIQWRVGVMVLATILVTGILVVLLGDMDTFVQRRYLIEIRFPSVPGVTPETPVRQFGLLVGRVTDVRIADDRRGAIVTAAINEGTKIYRDEACRLNASLLGDAVIEFVPGAVPEEPVEPDAARRLVEPGEEIAGSVATSPLEVVTSLQGELTEAARAITAAGQEVGRAGNEIDTLVKRVNKFLDENDEQVRNIVSDTEKMLTSIRESAQSVQKLLTDEEVGGKLRQTIDKLPVAMSDLSDAIDSIRQNFENLEAFTASIKNDGPNLVARLDRSMNQLEQTFREIEGFSRSLNDPNGNLSRFLNDPDLYANVDVIANNLRLLTIQLRPILDDVRSFTNQLGRDPAKLINVRTATEQRSLLKQ